MVNKYKIIFLIKPSGLFFFRTLWIFKLKTSGLFLEHFGFSSLKFRLDFID